MSEPTMILYPTDIPGLVNADCPDGVVREDLTVGQVVSLAVQNGWEWEPARG